MSLWKRSGGQYWTDFVLDGERFRLPLKRKDGTTTKDEREAKRLEKDLITEASKGNVASSQDEFSRLGFKKAADQYIEEIELRLQSNSVTSEGDRAERLKAHFKNRPLFKIRATNVRKYMTKRKRQGKSNRTINMELGVLRRIMKRAKLWHRLADEIKPLPGRHDEVGRALRSEEKLRLLKTASEKPDWMRAR